MNKDLLKDILRGIISVALVLTARCIDIYVFTGITEIIWLVCGYMVCWVWNEVEK